MLTIIYNFLVDYMYKFFYYIIDKFLDVKVYLNDVYKTRRDANNQYNIYDCLLSFNKDNLSTNISLYSNVDEIDFNNKNYEYYKFIPTLKMNTDTIDYKIDINDNLTSETFSKYYLYNITDKTSLTKIKENIISNIQDNTISLPEYKQQYMSFMISVECEKDNKSIYSVKNVDITKLINMFNTKLTYGLLLYALYINNELDIEMFKNSNTKFEYNYMTSSFDMENNSVSLNINDTFKNLFERNIK